MRAKRAGNEAEATGEKYEHHQSAEEAGGAKVDMHIGDDTGEDEKRARRGENPASDAAAVRISHRYIYG